MKRVYSILALITMVAISSISFADSATEKDGATTADAASSGANCSSNCYNHTFTPNFGTSTQMCNQEGVSGFTKAVMEGTTAPAIEESHGVLEI